MILEFLFDNLVWYLDEYKEYIGMLVVGYFVLLVMLDALFEFLGIEEDFLENEAIYKQLDTLPKAKLISESLDWCIQRFGPSQKGAFPQLEISYYPHRKRNGVYYSGQNKIVVYVPNHEHPLQLIDTVIHEYQHYLEIHSHYLSKAYDDYLEETGYWDNPFEISAREFAKKHRVEAAMEICKLVKA